MNRLILAPLFIFIVIGILAMLIGSVGNYTIVFNEHNYNFNFNLDDAVKTIIASVIGGLVLVGFRILDSGLNDETVRIISACILFATLWTAISLFSKSFIVDIPIFGIVVWSVLSFIYIIGVFMEVSEGGASIESN